MKNNNQINVPQAREAMDRFKMLIAPRSASTCGVHRFNNSITLNI